MKKLLAIVLVLGLASMASALTIGVAGPATLNFGQTGVYTVSVLSGSLISYDITFNLSNSMASATGAAILAAGRNPQYDFIGLPEVSASADSGALGADLFTVNVMAGTTKGSFNITLGDVYQADTSWNQVVPTMVGIQGIQVVPEPITMSLLGLGGLVALRRRMA